MLRKIGIMFVMAALMIAAVSIPSLAATGSQYEQQILQVRYDSVSARVGFTTGVMTDIVSLIPQASDLNSNIDQLNADMAALSSYVAAGDSGGFTSFVSGTLNKDLQSANQAIASDRSHYREWNVTPQTRQELKVKYDGRKATLDSQMNGVTLRLGNIRLDRYDTAVANYDARIEKLGAKGVDVSGMQGVKAGAEASVIAPLQNAVASGNTVEVRTQLKDKSLGNGAPYSYHFWAKMDMECGKAVTARMADNATGAGYGDQLAEVNAKLAAVQSTLDTVGTNPYTTEQKDSVWNGLKAAAEGLKGIIRALGGH